MGHRSEVYDLNPNNTTADTFDKILMGTNSVGFLHSVGLHNRLVDGVSISPNCLSTDDDTCNMMLSQLSQRSRSGNDTTNYYCST